MLATMRHQPLALLALAVLAACVAPPEPLSGPMLADVGTTEAALWAQFAGGAGRTVVARLQPATGGPALQLSCETGRDGLLLLHASGLQPGTRYDWELAGRRGSLRTAEHWVIPGAMRPPPALRWVFGSCAFVNDPAFDRPDDPYGRDEGIFGAMAAERPDFVLWLGDNVYFRAPDTESEAGLRRRWSQARGLPALQELLACAPHYAICDDHDYGPNDSDRSYWLAPQARAAFRDFFPSAGPGTPAAPGLFRTLIRSDVEFFLLDDRSFRSPNAAPPGPDKVMLGEAQRQWLLDALTSSRATFKVVCCGNQMLNPRPYFEGFAHFAHERQGLLDELEARRIEGLVFLSGDVHFAELLRLERPGAYPLLEFTSSPLTAGLATTPQPVQALRVPGTWVPDRRNYGLAEVTGPPGARELRLACRDATGAELWSHTLREDELRYPR